MFSLIREQCLAHGYRHYEISNFARPGFASRHNTNYWTGGKYLGLGAGAHSFTDTPDWGRRWQNERQPKMYMKQARASGQARSAEENLTRTQACGEFLFLRLRQLDGLPLELFSRRFGAQLAEEFPHLQGLLDEGLLQEQEGILKLTPKGLLLADTIFTSFM